MDGTGNIDCFAKTITRGPFKILQDGGTTSLSFAPKSGDSGADSKCGDAFACAVYQGYLDMCRTLPTMKDEERRQARACIASSLREYFGDEPKAKTDAFDNWYRCMFFEERVGSQDLKLTVGQIQKIVNMAFKYLYCLRDIRESWQEYFKFCHMPLDRYTLAWYKEECDSGYSGPAWSKIDDVSHYFEIQGKVRERFEESAVLVGEFSIWERQKEIAEALDARRMARKLSEYKGCPSSLRAALVEFAAATSSEAE